MIWMSWRQFRAQAVVAAAALVAIATYLVILGMQIRKSYDGSLARCQGQGNCAALMSQFQGEYRTLLLVLDAGLLVLVPAILGLFWGAPIVARELEAGTHRLVWNQSVTRRRWLAGKLLVVGLASMAAAGLVSLLLTWVASPVDHLAADQFTGLVFGARNIVPIAYAAFAFVLGAVIGMLVRRVLLAMALTMLVFTVVQVVMPNLVRPHLMPPITVSQPITADVINDLQSLGSLSGGPVIGGLKVPNAWVSYTSELLTSNGQPLDTGRFNDCISPSRARGGGTGRFDGAAQCLGSLNLHVMVEYQPNNRYWSFQWLESAIFLALSVLLAGLGMWRIQRHVT